MWFSRKPKPALKLISAEVVVGDSPAVYDELASDNVVGAVWTGAWSKASLTFAAALDANPKYHEPGRDWKIFKGEGGMLEADNPNAAAFAADTAKFVTLFRALGMDLAGTDQARDKARMEAGPADSYVEFVNPWHIDGRYPLTMLSVPSNLTTRYLDRVVPGYFDSTGGFFRPTDEAATKAATQVLPNNAVIVFKSAGYVFTDGEDRHGLIHSPPSADLRRQHGGARPVIHYSL